MDTTIGEYRLLEPLGSGAGGEVFRAEHTITRRIEAIKILRDRQRGGARDEASLLQEIEIQASLRHPHIATVHHAFRIPEGLALVMELAEGQPLSSILERGRVPLAQGAGYVLQTLDALAYAHERRVVHRDVKPSNILVASDGSVKLTDFGLAQILDEARSEAAGTAAGSPYYMSPEQVVGVTPADARSDCYSVGVILYEIATGRRPFEGASAFEVMLQHRESQPVSPLSLESSLGPALDAVILKAIEKDPDRRFQSASEFRTAIESALAVSPAMRIVAPIRIRRSGWAPLRWTVAALVAALAVAVAIGSAVVLLPVLHRPPVAPAKPVEERIVVPAATIPPPPPAPAPVRKKPQPKPAPQTRPGPDVVPDLVPDPAPLAEAQENTKRQGRLRRALGWIARPFSRP